MSTHVAAADVLERDQRFDVGQIGCLDPGVDFPGFRRVVQHGVVGHDESRDSYM
jgi:hypothetical protein